MNLWKNHLVSIEYETTTAGWIGGHQLDPVKRVVPGRGEGGWVRLRETMCFEVIFELLNSHLVCKGQLLWFCDLEKNVFST